jgi:outer membrane murein-binding lipoprotein Lpp
MIGFKHALAAIVGVALLAVPANAEPNGDMNKSVDKIATAVRQLQDDVETLKLRVKQLEDEVKVLRQLANTPSSTSKRESFDTTARMGRVRLSNEYLEEMSVVVNGVSYRLLPGQTRTIQVPPGIFTYQVLQLQRAIQERTIEPGEEKPIRIFTQR